MRFIKWTLIALVGSFLLYELLINMGALGHELELKVGLPWLKLGVLVMPVWAALLLAAVAAFLFAILLEIGAWYEYTRTIRLQRLQIKGLQKALNREKTEPQPPEPQPPKPGPPKPV